MTALQDFLSLPTEEVAHLVRQAGPQVCVFPINGTRRWFVLEKAAGLGAADYMDAASEAYIRLFGLCFAHGIDTLLSPLFGGELMGRGEEYTQAMIHYGLPRLITDPFLSFYDRCQVRVRFYGNYREHLPKEILTQLEDLTAHTAGYEQHRLFIGLFGDDATAAIGKAAILYHQEHGQIPDRRALIEAYYGEYMPPATLFFGFDRFSVFDYPLLGLGQENLYFSVAPSPYLDQTGLRTILYDHLFSRPLPEPAWDELPSEIIERLRTYYHANQNTVLGVGTMWNGIWIPATHEVDS
ncbi:MAG: hypothetical protein JXB85_04630 [Anaerolineales bacterium]|nr:hypothetical protein [Anaerolineales bacterium]